MKQFFHQILASVLALLVLASTISWTVDKHFCMGRVMDISFFVHADDCGMEEAMAVMEDQTLENSCCDDESFTVKGQDDLKLSWNDLDLEQQQFLAVFAQSYLDIFNPVEELPVPHEQYPPPILVRDIHILDQVFLI